MKKIELVKGEDIFIVRYEPTDAPVVVDVLCDWVADWRLNFDQFDAAVMSMQLGKEFARQVTEKLNQR